ncbi:MAG: ABC transporter ATP-binding protein/permease [Clostridiales bacterium]|nr:ABC transporter ATP-binding protein/permease [Clostridiales bacterium]
MSKKDKAAKASLRSERRESWRRLFKIYTKIKIPWLWMILVAALSFAYKEVQVLVVPYQTKIMTGAITDHGFLAGFLVLTFAATAVEAVQGAVNELTAIMTARNARRSIWTKLLLLPMKFFRNKDPQEYISRITQDTSGLFAALAILINLASLIFAVVEAFRRMYATYNTLALIMLSGIPIMILGAWITGKFQYKIIHIQNTAMAKMTGFFAERLPSLMHIKTSNMEDEEYLKGIEANNARYKAECRMEIYQILMGPIGSFAQTFNQVVLLIVASALVRQGTMEMYQLVNLYNYYLLFMGNSFLIMSMWQMLKMSHGASEVVGQILDAEPESLEVGEPMGEQVEDITFDHIAFSYDGKTPVLRDASFTIPKGKKTVIVGENGCGKSTSIKLLEGFEEPDSGTISIGGRNVKDINLKELRDKVGYLFQGNQIVKGTIEENIRYGIDRDCTEEEIVEAAKAAKAYDFINEKDEGFRSEISRFDNKVSGGEMQRIAVARMILKDPDYLIMDEATSGIDLISARAVNDSVSQMMKDKTIVAVSHDFEEIKKADHIVVLNKGYVEAEGDYNTVYNNSELFRQFAE